MVNTRRVGSMRGLILVIVVIMATLIATQFVFFAHILLLDAAESPATASKESKVVFLGDSWAEFAGDLTLVDHCPTVTQFANRGVSGSTAREWQEGEGCGGTACSPAAAFDGGDFTHAWVSIGGNDFLQNDCRPPEDLRNVIDTAFEDIAAAAGPGVKILTTGYGAVPTDEEGCTPADSASANSIIAEASEAMGWTHVDVLKAFGGSATEVSSSEFYADALHLNEDGYAHLWTLPKIQAFFECYTPKAYVEVGRACRPTEPYYTTTADADECRLLCDADDGDADAETCGAWELVNFKAGTTVRKNECELHAASSIDLTETADQGACETGATSYRCCHVDAALVNTSPEGDTPAPQPSDAAPTPSPSRDSSDGAAARRAGLGIAISGALALLW
jgi:hypothetical protein